MSTTVKDIEFYINSLMKNLNIKDYKMDITGNSEKGDGYLGEISFITVSTDEKTYNLVIKSAKKGKELREQTPLHECYLRENFMYSKVFPIFKEFQAQKGLNKPFDSLAKCFITFDEELRECLVLQNLKAKGFDLHDRRKPMNIHHTLLVLKNYGRYHALSYALRDQKPSIFNAVTKNLTNLMGELFTQVNMANKNTANFKIAIRLLEDEHPELYKKLQSIENEIVGSMGCEFDLDDPSLVILQGDCWNNNFMFKYENDATNRTKPSDMVFLDFQTSRLASPVLDLSYFIYSTSSKETLKQFDVLLDAYYQSLKECLVLLGTDVRKYLPFKKLKEHWRNHSKFGFFISLFVLKFTLLDKEDVPDINDFFKEEDDVANNFDLDFKTDDLYNNRIKDVLIHYAERFL